MLNAFQRMDNFHRLEYNKIKKRLLANPIADKNRQEVLNQMQEILQKAHGDPNAFLRALTCDGKSFR